jgi:hypothetical protein
MGRLFKLAFWCLTLNTTKGCHMDLWFARLVLTHHYFWLQHLPSASFTRSKSKQLIPFNCRVFSSGGLPFDLYSVRLRAVVQLSLLSRCFMRLALLFGLLASVWLPHLSSHWSGSGTVPLTLGLRFLTCAKLWLYRTSLPRLIVFRTIWSECSRPRWSLDAGCPMHA